MPVSRARIAPTAADPLARVIVALGITQILGWGTTVYALGVLAKPIMASTGWSAGVVFGGLTGALLASGATSVPVGRWLDRRGGRRVMTIGSALIAAGLAALSQVQSLPAYFAVWMVIGVAMRMILYDAAFASLVQMAPSGGRRAISLLTLFGGLASSLLWPAGAALEATIGWRQTLLVYAALNLGVCLPLHWSFLVRRGSPPGRLSSPDALVPLDVTAPTPHATAAPALSPSDRRRAMILFASTMAASGLVTGAIAVQMVAVLVATGIDQRLAVGLAAMQGVAQTLARLVDLVFGRRLHALTLGRITSALLAVALLVLVAGGTGWPVAIGFVVLFGAANGLTTIVRGTVPLALFGAHGFGEMLGQLAIPVLAMNAAAPAALAVMTERVGNTAAIETLAVTAVVAWMAMEGTARWYRRTQRRGQDRLGQIGGL